MTVTSVVAKAGNVANAAIGTSSPHVANVAIAANADAGMEGMKMGQKERNVVHI